MYDAASDALFVLRPSLWLERPHLFIAPFIQVLSPSTEIANKVLAFQKYNHNLLVKVKTFHGNNFLLMCKVLRSKWESWREEDNFSQGWGLREWAAVTSLRAKPEIHSLYLHSHSTTQPCIFFITFDLKCTRIQLHGKTLIFVPQKLICVGKGLCQQCGPRSV